MSERRDYWPVRQLRLRTADLLLRPVVETDLADLADASPDDAEPDPTLPSFGDTDLRLARGRSLHQKYWQSLGTWSVDSWTLMFVVLARGRPVGIQAVEGEHFLQERTVDSFSHLAPDARGRGWGKQARRAILALAFGPLGAEAAVTSAWWHNLASLGVSRSLGYRFVAEHPHPTSDGGSDRMVYLRLSRPDWAASGGGQDVRIDGFEPGRVLFGLTGR